MEFKTIFGCSGYPTESGVYLVAYGNNNKFAIADYNCVTHEFWFTADYKNETQICDVNKYSKLTDGKEQYVLIPKKEFEKMFTYNNVANNDMIGMIDSIHQFIKYGCIDGVGSGKLETFKYKMVKATQEYEQKNKEEN